MTARASVRLAVATLVVAIVASCGGELRFEDPEGGADGEGGTTHPGADSSTDGTTASDAPITRHCSADPDCGLATLHCDTVAGACVPCLNDTHCTTDEDRKRCDTALHRCVECGSDGDCGGIRKCQPDAHRCVTPCTTITECVTAPDPICDTTKGFCTRCTGATCPFTPDDPICDPAGFCVECTTDASCSGSKPRCDGSSGKCVQCTASTDCPGAAPCDPKNGTCVGG